MTLRKGALAVALCLGSLLLHVPAKAQDFHKGLDAFNAGEYAEAYANWWPLAVRGDAKAQASIGFMFYSGKGVRQDDSQALVWFGRAAEAGQPTAQFFLGLHYLYGKGVPVDRARAHAWCDISLSNGYSEALFCRDAVAAHLSADDMRRSSEFYRTHAFRN